MTHALTYDRSPSLPLPTRCLVAFWVSTSLTLLGCRSQLPPIDSQVCSYRAILLSIRAQANRIGGVDTREKKSYHVFTGRLQSLLFNPLPTALVAVSTGCSLSSSIHCQQHMMQSLLFIPLPTALVAVSTGCRLSFSILCQQHCELPLCRLQLSAQFVFHRLPLRGQY